MTSPKADIAAHRPGELIACFLAAEKWRSGPFEGLCWSPTALSLFLHHLHLQVFCNLRLIPREILSSFVLTPVPHLKKNLPPFTRQIPRSSRCGSAVGRLLQNRTLGKHTRVCLAGLDWRRPRPPQPRGPASLRSPRGPHPGDPRPVSARALPTPAKLGKLSRLRVVPCIPRPRVPRPPRGLPVPRARDCRPLT